MLRTPVPRNRLLRALPAADFERLLPDLTTIAAPTRYVFHKRDEPIQYVYFPNGGVASLTAVLSDGNTVAAATIGREGSSSTTSTRGEDAVACWLTMGAHA